LGREEERTLNQERTVCKKTYSARDGNGMDGEPGKPRCLYQLSRLPVGGALVHQTEVTMFTGRKEGTGLYPFTRGDIFNLNHDRIQNKKNAKRKGQRGGKMD